MTLQQLKKTLSKKQTITIFTHWSPDGDAMGSSLGLYNYLKLGKHTIRVITPNDYPDYLHWIPGNSNVLDFQKEEKKALAHIQKSDIIFCLDFNHYYRLEDKLGAIASKAKGLKVLIDHHEQPTIAADYVLHNVHSSSTCELVYDFICSLGGKKAITKNIANCLYTGIMTDTGSFKFPSTKAKTHRVIADLIEAGAENSKNNSLIHDNYTYDRLKLLGYSLYEKLNVMPEIHTAYLGLTQKEQDKFNFKKGDTEGLVNYALSIKEIKFSVFFTERDGKVKMSFRSKGAFDVNKFARKHFDGGGHKNASGASSKLSLKQTIDKFLKALPDYKTELTRS
ncbi:MAG: bifunctional oligoribonuclease/PAP phosphatase NrnA [Bacteroidetes bacterium]|nr:bifunctional oligoribonuclease/PAP phosphatase NrnA [Bacteroidota bacterium]